jgi:hypothetical protein
VLLQQLEDVELPSGPGEEWGEPKVMKDTETGAIWCRADKIPSIIEALQRTLRVLQDAAQEDTERHPTPNWGSLKGQSPQL